MKSLFKIVAVLFLVSCDSETTTGGTTNPFIGTWNYNNFEMKQDVTTNSDQTTIPVMGTMAGIIPFNNGLVIQGDGNNDTLNYMYMFGGILNMDFMTLEALMDSEGDSEEPPEELCMLNLMMSGDYNEDNKIDYLIMCGGSYYMGNLPEDAMASEQEEDLDFSQPLISIDQPVTFYNLHPDSLFSESFVLNTTNNPKAITLSGSLNYPEITVLADNPTDLMELQLGLSLEEFYELELEEGMEPMYEMAPFQTIIINDDNTITVYKALDYDEDTIEATAIDTCTGTWTLNGDILSISEEGTCTSEDYEDYENKADYPECIASCPGVDDINPDMPTEFCTWVTVTAESTCFAGCTGEDLDDVNEVIDDCMECLASNSCNHEESDDDDDDYEDEDGPDFDDEMPTISMNSDGHLTFGLSTNSYCEFLGTSEFMMFDEDEVELDTESDCKAALEEMLFFETGSIKSVEIAMHSIYTNENLTARINNNKNQTDFTKQQKVIINWLQSLYPQTIDYSN